MDEKNLLELVLSVDPVHLQSLFIFLGGVVAVISVVSARVTAKKRQTADLLLNSRADKELVEGLRCLAKLHDSATENTRSYASPEKSSTPQAQSIRYVLNHWEYVSVGIQSKIYDEEMLRRASYNTVVKLFQCARPFIDRLREDTKRPTLYQELEWLYLRWEKAGPPAKKK